MKKKTRRTNKKNRLPQSSKEGWDNFGGRCLRVAMLLRNPNASYQDVLDAMQGKS